MTTKISKLAHQLSSKLVTEKWIHRCYSNLFLMNGNTNTIMEKKMQRKDVLPNHGLNKYRNSHSNTCKQKSKQKQLYKQELI